MEHSVYKKSHLRGKVVVIFKCSFITGILLTNLKIADCASCTSSTIGESNLNGDTDDSTPGQGYLMAVTSFEIGCCGVIDSWTAKFSGTSGSASIAFQVWRLTSGTTYELVGENNYVITSDGTLPLSVTTGNQISVQNGDKWGWWTSGTPIIPYKGNGASRTDDNQLLVLSDLTAGQTEDWSAATEQDDRSYSISLTLAPGNAPSFTNLPGSTSINNDETSGTSLITIAVTDTDTYDIGSLTVSIETSTTEFSFDTSSLILSTGTLTTNAGNVPLKFKVTDPCGNTATATYTVTIVNPPPVIHNTPSSIFLSEDVTAEQHLFTVNVTDGETVTCTEGTGFVTASFEVKLIAPANTDYGVYSRASPGFDYATQSQYDLLVDCADSSTTVTGTYSVYLQQNQPPAFTNLQNSTSVSTNASLGTVFTVFATDPENDALTYTMTCSASPCPFIIVNDTGEVQLTQDLTNHTVVGYDLYVIVNDTKNSVGPSTLTITITDINDPVTISNLPLSSALSVFENTALTTSVYNVTYSDNDISQTHTWNMTSSPSGGLTYFSIDSSGYITTSGTVIDYETISATSFTFTVTVADPLTSDSELLVVDILNVNEAPVVSPNSYSLSASEGTAGTVLGTPSYGVTDQDANETVTYTADCGTNAAYFLMNASTGQVTYQSDYDLDTGTLSSTVTCTVTFTDNGGLTDTASLIINIADINDNTPAFAPNSYTFYVSYYADAGATVGTITATDDDSGTFGDLTYTINQTSLGVQHFSVDSNGVITVYLAPDAGTSGVNYSSSYSLTATVTDGGGLTDTASVTFVITDTTTASPTTTTPRYKTFFEGKYNLAWFVPCMVAILTTVMVSGWVVYTCKGKHGCQPFLKSLKKNLKFRPRAGHSNSKPYVPDKDSYHSRLEIRTTRTSVRNFPPPTEMQTWRKHRPNLY